MYTLCAVHISISLYIYMHIYAHTYTFSIKPILNIHGNLNSIQPKLRINYFSTFHELLVDIPVATSTLFI